MHGSYYGGECGLWLSYCKFMHIYGVFHLFFTPFQIAVALEVVEMFARVGSGILLFYFYFYLALPTKAPRLCTLQLNIELSHSRTAVKLRTKFTCIFAESVSLDHLKWIMNVFQQSITPLEHELDQNVSEFCCVLERAPQTIRSIPFTPWFVGKQSSNTLTNTKCVYVSIQMNKYAHTKD